LRICRLIESTEYAIAGLTTLVSAWVLVGSPWEPSTVPIVLWLVAIVIAGRLTIRPLLRLAQRATMHRDLVIAAAEAERTRLAADLHDDALQELTRLAVQAETGERSRLMLDIAGHRAQRRAVVVEIAQTAIAEVKTTGTQKALEDMSAFERKIVHDEVAAAGLGSESEGVEPHRHIIVFPA